MHEPRHRRASARTLLLVLAACLQAAGATFTCQPTNNAADCSALGELFAAGGGGAWVGLPASDGWLQAAAGNAADLCSPGVFTGVTCDASGRVAAISLIQNGLVGSLSGSLGNLSHLTRLSLSNNALAGTLPASLCALTSLNWLSLFNNRGLTGTIPSCIGSLSRLENLFLGNMQLTGTLPNALGSLTAMRQFGVHLNNFTGTMPPSLGNMLNATLLWMYGNQLSGAVPSSYCSLSRLALCDLQSQRSYAFAPCYFGGSCNTLTSACHIPTCGNFSLACAPSNNATVCRALSDLFVATAGWAWSASVGWSAAASNTTTDYCTFQGITCTGGAITQINLASTNLNGTLPASLANIDTLQRLALQTNLLRGTIPEELSLLVNLQELVLYDNNLRGPVPSSLSNMSALTFLAVSGNSLSGLLPESFCQLQSQLASGGVFGCVLATVAAGENNTFACPLPCSADTAGAAFISKCGIAQCTAAISPAAEEAQSAGVAASTSLALGLGLGLGGGLFLCLLAAALFVKASKAPHRSSSSQHAWQAPQPNLYDVFISYRRVDHRIMETITDKLKLAGLRVFVDRAGDMAGKPFKTEIFNAMKSSTVIVPLITNEVMRTLSSCEHDAWETKLDFLIVEYLFALHLLYTDGVARLYPLLVGDEFFNSTTQRLEWDNLLRNESFKSRLAALPDVVPRASLACAYSVILESQPAVPFTLPQELTVRDIVCGRKAQTLPVAPSGGEDEAGAAAAQIKEQLMHGILSMDAFPLACPQEDLDLYIRAQFVENLRKPAGMLGGSLGSLGSLGRIAPATSSSDLGRAVSDEA